MITFDNTTKKATLPPLIKINQVTEILSISKATVHNLIDDGELKAACLNPAAKERKHLLVTSDSLLKLYKKRFGHSLLLALAHRHET